MNPHKKESSNYKWDKNWGCGYNHASLWRWTRDTKPAVIKWTNIKTPSNFDRNDC